MKVVKGVTGGAGDGGDDGGDWVHSGGARGGEVDGDPMLLQIPSQAYRPQEGQQLNLLAMASLLVPLFPCCRFMILLVFSLLRLPLPLLMLYGYIVSPMEAALSRFDYISSFSFSKILLLLVLHSWCLISREIGFHAG